MTKATPMKKHMLVIEDESTMSTALRNRFEKHGFDVTTCGDGRLGMQQLGLQKYDIILLDIVMPEKSGFDILAERKDTINATTPIFVLTNYGQEENLQRAKDLGAVECYVKSHTSLKDITQAIEKHVQ
jgi:DNA-binding response OmpR family regulator